MDYPLVAAGGFDLEGFEREVVRYAEFRFVILVKQNIACPIFEGVIKTKTCLSDRFWFVATLKFVPKAKAV